MFVFFLVIYIVIYILLYKSILIDFVKFIYNFFHLFGYIFWCISGEDLYIAKFFVDIKTFSKFLSFSFFV